MLFKYWKECKRYLQTQLINIFSSPFINKKQSHSIDNKIKECQDALLIQSTPLEKKEMRAKILKQYLFSNLTSSDNKLHTVCLNIQKQLIIHTLSKEKLIVRGDVTFHLLKINYLKNLDLSAVHNKILNDFLLHEEINAIAEQIDKRMTYSISIQDFAELIAIDCPNQLKLITTEHFHDTYAAVFLLQKNIKFSAALEDMILHLEKLNKPSYNFIKTSCTPYLEIIKTVRTNKSV